MPFLQTQQKQIKRSISYGAHEKRVLEMEAYLMDHYGYNKSQLHKTLVRERYCQVRML